MASGCPVVPAIKSEELADPLSGPLQAALTPLLAEVESLTERIREYDSPACRAARSISSLRWLPASSRRCQSFSLSAIPPAPLVATPSRILLGEWLHPSAAASVRSSRGLALTHPARSAGTDASTANRHTPGDASFAVDPFKKADQHQTEVHARHERRTAQLLVIKLPAPALAELVEACFVQQLVQPPIERMTGSFGQLTEVPETLLPLPMLARSHRHSRILS